MSQVYTDFRSEIVVGQRVLHVQFKLFFNDNSEINNLGADFDPNKIDRVKGGGK